MYGGAPYGGSGLAEKVGPRNFDGGPYNNAFNQSGATKAPFMAPGPFNPMLFMRPFRRRINLVGLFITILVPVVTFALIYWMTSFNVQEWFPAAIYMVLGLGLLTAGIFAVKGWLIRRHQEDEQIFGAPLWWLDDDPMWFLFLAASILVACILGYALGQYNHETNMTPYYFLHTLGVHRDVDPVQGGGRAYLDAGAVEFKQGSYVDISKSIGYKDGDIYCIAPITLGNDDLAFYDFWAVGINCCDGFPKNFQCFPDRNDPLARSGLRLVDDSLRPYFRVAVQQAEAEFFKVSKHPMFFTWMRDAPGAIDRLAATGWRWFWLGVLGFTLAQTAATILMAYRSWKKRSWG